jgi:hypothetical protein
MMVEMLVRRVVDGRVQLSVELVDTYKGDTECVAQRPLGRLTALAVDSRSPRCTTFVTTVGPTAVEDVSSRQKSLPT